MRLSDYVNTLRINPDFGPAVVYHHHLSPQEADYDIDPALPSEIQSILPLLGVDRLFRHQVEALRKIRQGSHTLVATPTASGKSLIYNLSVLEALLKNPDAKALYLFPLKALEQDQLKNLSLLIKNFEKRKISAGIYDGDTSPFRRKQIRSKVPEILVTNPDMLHTAILAYHHGWEKLFKNLAFVVMDEVHSYRGIFGSHMNQIIRRLKRLCAFYGSRPQFILLSATVNNPKAFGESLIEESVEVINISGAPRSGRHLLFMNPASSPNFSSAKLFTHCVQNGFRTIAFTQSRKTTELIHVWVSRLSPHLRGKISSYRAGFMPGERREIESKLASGELLGVVSTSALELGIDIGFLDICLLVGYPGTMITTWQRGGRVGRSGRDSLIILLAKPDALDQYFMKHPEQFFERPFESALLDPHNPFVVEAHLPCAAAEKQLTLQDAQWWPKDFSSHLEKLELRGLLTRSMEGEPEWFPVRTNPHQRVNIRGVGESFTIFEEETGEAVGTVDGFRAFKECHPGAIYLHRAKQHIIRNLDLEKHDVIAHPTGLQYFTRALSQKETEILEVLESKPTGQFIVREGRVKVTEKVIAFEKRALPGQELLGVFPLELPAQTFESLGFWVEIESPIQHFVERKGLHFMGGIHAIEHAAIGIFPLFALCDRNDIGGICYTHHPQIGKSAIFIYDGYPGGVGLAQHGFRVVQELLEKTLEHLKTCGCEDGCPSCIHSPKCGSGNKPLDKKAAVIILEFLLGQIPLSLILETAPEEEQPFLLPETEQPPTSPKEPRIVFLDLETQKSAKEVGGWRNIHLMKVSVVVIFDSLEKKFLTFSETEVNGLLAHLDKADLIIGFNIKRFDYTVLGAYTGKNLQSLPTFDMLEDIHHRLGFRLGLDHLASETLNRRKSADGLQALEWFKQGDLEKLADYCRMDVELTRDLFMYGLEKGHLIYRAKQKDRRVMLRLDWTLDNMLKKG
ncbi:MAG: DEAD/DEAH box helicase [Deltaproteobacteria bacterium]|nr:DEAD/DEAH box helicase [Deltaproteobacteria bacterium]